MSFLSRLLGKACAHYFSWPRTDAEGRYYQTCSRCGIAYEYDWATMRRTNHLIRPNVTYSPTSVVIPRNQMTTRVPLVR